MSGADRLEDGFPHGTTQGYEQGCRGGWCPEGNAHGLSCKRAKQLAAGDYRYQRLVKTGHTPAQIADQLGLAPETHQAPTYLPEETTMNTDPTKEYRTKVRAWANQNGIHIGDRGRIPQHVYDAYENRNAQPAPETPKPATAPVEPQGPESTAHEAVKAGEDTTTLDGATDLPEEGMHIGTPGEFAALWNSRNDAQRAYMLELIRNAQADQMRCVLEDHAGQHDHLDRIARAHHAAVSRAEVAEDALALALQKWGKALQDLEDAHTLIHALSAEVVAAQTPKAVTVTHVPIVAADALDVAEVATESRKLLTRVLFGARG